MNIDKLRKYWALYFGDPEDVIEGIELDWERKPGLPIPIRLDYCNECGIIYIDDFLESALRLDFTSVEFVCGKCRDIMDAWDEKYREHLTYLFWDFNDEEGQ